MQAPAVLNPGEPQYRLNGRSGGPQSQFGGFGKKKTLSLKRERERKKNSMKKTKINLSKPTGYVMHQQFNIQQLYALPTLYLCFVFI